MGQSTLFCVEDHFYEHKHAFLWALTHLVNEGDELHVVTVLPLSAYSASPRVRAVGGDNPGQQAAEDLVAVDVLRETLGDIKRLRIKLKNIKTQALVARACNQGADLVEYADSRNVDLVVVGRRPMGPNMHKFLTLTCTLCYWKGNVSDHCVHNMHCPVLVVSPDAVKDFEGLQPQQISPGSSLPRSSLSSPGSLRKQRNLCMAVDGSKSSKDMIQWAVEHLIRTTDELHIISVTDLPAADKDVIVDYQTGKRTDDGASSSESSRWVTSVAESVAKGIVDVFMKHGVPLTSVCYKTLVPEGGAFGVADSICNYLEQNDNDMLVVGNRGLGTLQRALEECVGRSSVSDYCARFAPCPVLVYRQ